MKRIVFMLILMLLSVSGTHSNHLNLDAYNIGSSDEVVEVGFHSSNGSADRKLFLLNLGHAFVSFKNISNDELLVGEYKLNKDEEITVGLWSILGKYGTWYNIESYAYNNLGRYSDIVSTSFKIDQSKLDDINIYINSDPLWYIVYNCSSFVTEILNIVTNSDMHTILMTPNKLQSIFKEYKIYEVNSFMDNDNVGYFKNGEFVKCAVKVS